MSHLIYQTVAGPFRETTFAIFVETSNSSFRLSWDEGPEYTPEPIFNDEITVFKFLKGTYADLQVVFNFHSGRLEYSGRQYRAPGKATRAPMTAAELEAIFKLLPKDPATEAGGPPPPCCASLECSVCPCPVDEPVIDCQENKCKPFEDTSTKP